MTTNTNETTAALPVAVTEYPAECLALEVIDQASYGRAGEAVSLLGKLELAVTDHFRPMKSAAHTAWKACCARENEHLAPIQAACQQLRSRMKAWLAIEERRRLEAARAAEAAARAERVRLEREAEMARQAQRAATAQRLEARAEQAAVKVEQAAAAVVAPPPKAPAGWQPGPALSIATRRMVSASVQNIQVFLAAVVARGDLPGVAPAISIRQADLLRWLGDRTEYPGLAITVEQIPVISSGRR